MAKALAEGYVVQPINFNYGQKNIVELEAQKAIIEEYSKRHGDRILKPLNLDLNTFMTEPINHFKDLRDNGKIGDTTELEYYMPFRNMVFTSICAMVGELISMNLEDIDELAIGIGVHKHSGDVYAKDYWDITPTFVEKIRAVLELNDALKVTCYAPYADGFKDDIITDAIELDVPYLNTWTCYDPVISEYSDLYVAHPCRKCESCIERDLQGQKAGVDDINDYHIEINKENYNKELLSSTEIDQNNQNNDYFKVKDRV
jgi:7-cyano-7-deazaguanine synthase